MSTVRGPTFAREHPRALTAVLTVVGYVVVVGTLYGDVGLYPDISESTVDVLAAAIAVVNTLTVCCLVAGWYWIRNGEVRKHRTAMMAAFTLILLFLVLYLLKTGGGGTKEIALEPGAIYYAYLAMLAVHVLLSIVSVPVVLYAILLGSTHTPQELRQETPHRRVGRIAASAWIVSLSLGVVTYFMLNHLYGFEFVEAVVGVPLPA